MSKDKRCKRCLYWVIPEDKPEAIQGECRRHAPRPAKPFDPLFIWPETNENDWCGEFKAVRKKAKAAILVETQS